jgi:chromosome segregation ATPase
MLHVQALAAENISLDNQLLDLKSTKLRSDKDAKDALGKLGKLESQLAAAQARAAEAEKAVEEYQAEKRMTLARLMQAEARVRTLEEGEGVRMCRWVKEHGSTRSRVKWAYTRSDQ